MFFQICLKWGTFSVLLGVKCSMLKLSEKQYLFKEDISIREDEIFTFEYCHYIKSIKVLQSATYHYQQSDNSLMRRKYFAQRSC